MPKKKEGARLIVVEEEEEELTAMHKRRTEMKRRQLARNSQWYSSNEVGTKARTSLPFLVAHRPVQLNSCKRP